MSIGHGHCHMIVTSYEEIFDSSKSFQLQNVSVYCKSSFSFAKYCFLGEYAVLNYWYILLLFICAVGIGSNYGENVFWLQVVAACLFIIGSIVFTEYRHYDQINDAWFTLIPAIVLLGVGILLVLIGVVGCVGAVKEQRCLLGLVRTLNIFQWQQRCAHCIIK